MRFVLLVLTLILFSASQSWATLCGVSCFGQSVFEKERELVETPPCHQTSAAGEQVASSSDSAEGPLLQQNSAQLQLLSCFHEVSGVSLIPSSERSYQAGTSISLALSSWELAQLSTRRTILWQKLSEPPLRHGQTVYLYYQSLII